MEREREEKWKKMECMRVGKDGEMRLTMSPSSPTKTNSTEKEETADDDPSLKPEGEGGRASPVAQEGDEQNSSNEDLDKDSETGTAPAASTGSDT